MIIKKTLTLNSGSRQNSSLSAVMKSYVESNERFNVLIRQNISLAVMDIGEKHLVGDARLPSSELDEARERFRLRTSTTSSSYTLGYKNSEINSLPHPIHKLQNIYIPQSENSFDMNF